MFNQASVYLCYVFLIIALFSCSQEKATQATNQSTIPSDRVAWMSLEDAEKAMTVEPRDVFVMVYAKWCPVCKKFDKTTYQDPKVIQDLNTKYYPVKLDAHTKGPINFLEKPYANPNYDDSKAEDEVNSYHEIVYALEAGSIPSIVFLGKDLKRKGAEMGFKPADELRSLLAMYKSQ